MEKHYLLSESDIKTIALSGYESALSDLTGMKEITEELQDQLTETVSEHRSAMIANLFTNTYLDEESKDINSLSSRISDLETTRLKADSILYEAAKLRINALLEVDNFNEINEIISVMPSCPARMKITAWISKVISDKKSSKYKTEHKDLGRE